MLRLDVIDTRVLEVSLFHWLALYKLTFTYLLTYHERAVLQWVRDSDVVRVSKLRASCCVQSPVSSSGRRCVSAHDWPVRRSVVRQSSRTCLWLPWTSLETSADDGTLTGSPLQHSQPLINGLGFKFGRLCRWCFKISWSFYFTKLFVEVFTFLSK